MEEDSGQTAVPKGSSLIARCIVDDLDSLPGRSLRRTIAKRDGEIGGMLSVEDVFDVMAVEDLEEGFLRIFLHEVHGNECAYGYPLDLLEIIDAGVAEDWEIASRRVGGALAFRVLSSPEWLHEEHYYARLLDGEAGAVAAYRRSLERE